MLAALSQLKERGGSRTSALEIAAAAVAADPDSGISIDHRRELGKMIPAHYKAKQEEAKVRAQKKKKSKKKTRAGREAVRAGGSGSSRIQHGRVVGVSMARAGTQRNRTSKKKQSTEQKEQIQNQDNAGKLFYDSSDDMPLKVLKVKRGDAKNNININGKQWLVFCSQMDPTSSSGEYKATDESGSEIKFQGEYALPRIEEVSLFSERVARVFGQLEVKRTKHNGVRRGVGSTRNEASLTRARELVESGVYAIDTAITSGDDTDSTDEYDGGDSE
jgi:hypothetical protein